MKDIFSLIFNCIIRDKHDWGYLLAADGSTIIKKQCKVCGYVEKIYYKDNDKWLRF